MKNSNFIYFILLISFNTYAQITYVPDNNFEQALIDLNYDDTLDNYVETANISNIKSLDISNSDIHDLTGIEDFKALTILTAYNNTFGSLDLNSNTNLVSIDLFNCKITMLKIDKLNQLEYAYINDNLLNTLNITGNKSLIGLDVSNNNLTKLNLHNGNNNNFRLGFINLQNNNLVNIEVDNSNYSRENWSKTDPNIIFIDNKFNLSVINNLKKIIRDSANLSFIYQK